MTTLQFGSLVLGGGLFGETADREESFAVLDAFVAAGGRSIDTADAYSVWVPGHTGGESEAIIGEWITARGHRDRVEIATKSGNKPDRAGPAPATIRAAVDDSLVRLRTDYIDLYYAHRDDPDIPQEDVLGVLDELVRAGKVREIGASNFGADRIRSAVEISRREGLVAFTVAQDRYNLVVREPELELLPVLEELGIVEVPWAGLAHGFLTGAHRVAPTAPGPFAGEIAAYLADPRKLELLDVLAELAAAHGVSSAAIALAWLGAQPTVAAPIAAARTPDELVRALTVASVALSADEIARLSALTTPAPAPPNAT